MLHALKKLIPGRVKQEFKTSIKQVFKTMDANSILSKLYHPIMHPEQYPIHFHLDHQNPSGVSHPGSSVLLPPSHLRMGYAVDNDREYFDSGLASYNNLKKLYQAQNISMDEPGTKILDWGCATGRVIRHFGKEAEKGEVWGLDQDAASIQWDKENLSPPFHFLTCTEYPHLPFPDNEFNLVYGLSVFTHLLHYHDLWLMEFRRILKKGGCAIFTISDENTVEFFRSEWKPAWYPDSELANGLQHDITVYGGEDWGATFTFFKKQWVQKEWNRYLDVVAIVPRMETYQTAVVLRKA